MSNCCNTKIIQVNSGAGVAETWTRVLDSPTVGDVTFNGSLGSVLIVPKPLVGILGDASTNITKGTGLGVDGGDIINFQVDGLPVGSVEILGGVPHWVFN